MKVLLEGTLHLRYTRTESCSEEKARFNHSMLCGSVIIIIHCILLCNAHVSTKTKTTPTNAKIAHHDAPFVPNVIPRRNIPRLPTSCFSASHCCNSTVQTRRAGLAGHENENLSQLSHRTIRFFPCRRSNISFPKSFSLGTRCCCR